MHLPLHLCPAGATPSSCRLPLPSQIHLENGLLSTPTAPSSLMTPLSAPTLRVTIQSSVFQKMNSSLPSLAPSPSRLNPSGAFVFATLKQAQDKASDLAKAANFPFDGDVVHSMGSEALSCATAVRYIHHLCRVAASFN